MGCNECKIILPQATCGKIWQWYNLLPLLLETSGKGLLYYTWLSICGCLDECISDKNNLLKALCLRDLPNSWKKIVTITYSIKISPPSSEEPVIWGYFSLMDDPKCANKERLAISLVPMKHLAEMERYDQCHLLCFKIRYSVVS